MGGEGADTAIEGKGEGDRRAGKEKAMEKKICTAHRTRWFYIEFISYSGVTVG